MFDLKKLPVGDDPKKILKVILGLAATFLVLWVLVLAQTNQSDSGSSVNNGLVNSDSLNLSLKPVTKTATNIHNGSIFWHTFPVLLLLAFVIALLWFWQKKGTTKKSSDLFTIIGRQQLGVGLQIVVMFINEEYWVLSVSGKEISVLKRYDKTEWKGPAEDELETDRYSQFLSIFSEKQKKYAN